MAAIILLPPSDSLAIPTNSPPSITLVQPWPSYLWMNEQTLLMTDSLSWIWLTRTPRLSWEIFRPTIITVAAQFLFLMDTRKSINGWTLEVNRLLSRTLLCPFDPCQMTRTSHGS